MRKKDLIFVLIFCWPLRSGLISLRLADVTEYIRKAINGLKKANLIQFQPTCLATVTIYNAFHITTIFVPFRPCLSIHPFQNSWAYHVKSAYTFEGTAPDRLRWMPVSSLVAPYLAWSEAWGAGVHSGVNGAPSLPPPCLSGACMQGTLSDPCRAIPTTWTQPPCWAKIPGGRISALPGTPRLTSCSVRPNDYN